MVDAIVMTETGCSGRSIDGFRNERSKDNIYTHEHQHREDVVEVMLEIDFMYGLEYVNLVFIEERKWMRYYN